MKLICGALLIFAGIAGIGLQVIASALIWTGVMSVMQIVVYELTFPFVLCVCAILAGAVLLCRELLKS